MFKNILLPLDLTDKHQAALEQTAELALQSGGKVTLFHVIETIPGLSSEDEKPFYDRLERRARKHLELQGAALTARKISWTVEVRFGNRAVETADFAKSGADLIVLTTPRFDINNPTAGWGSMSWRISLLAPCPVFLVKRGKQT
jgi:nucleotide-binding universal stress UspA family protein